MNLTTEQVDALRAEAEREWNSKADPHNQWGELGRDEQDLAFAQVLQRHLLSQEPVALVKYQVGGNVSHGDLLYKAAMPRVVDDALVEKVAIAIRDAKAINPSDNYLLARAALKIVL